MPSKKDTAVSRFLHFGLGKCRYKISNGHMFQNVLLQNSIQGRNLKYTPQKFDITRNIEE